MSKLKVYEVSWRIPYAGEYVPLDPCAGGGYHRDLYGKEIITAHSARQAREIVKQVRGEQAKIKQPRIVAEL